MPFPMKIQPIDAIEAGRSDQAKPVPKSRLKRLFERQFPGVLRISSAERLAGGADLEPSSVCLDKMVLNFMEDNGEKPSSSRCGRSRCNCFHGNYDDNSDDDLDFLSSTSSSSASDAPLVSTAEVVKGLVICSTVAERNILAHASTIIDKSRNCKQKHEQMKAIAEGLRSLGYDASICKSRWEMTPAFPAGEHEYVDVIAGDERILVDVDFRSEFQIARSTKAYSAVFQALPPIFVGKEDRLGRIVAVVSEAVRLSLKKKGLDLPPWRKPEYMRSKWLAPRERSSTAADVKQAGQAGEAAPESCAGSSTYAEPGAENSSAAAWEPPEVKPKEVRRGAKLVAGLASAFSEKP